LLLDGCGHPDLVSAGRAMPVRHPLLPSKTVAAGVVLQHVRDGVRRLFERVGLVGDHPDLAGFEEPAERIQVLTVYRTRSAL
jgi:hypothetical protein